MTLTKRLLLLVVPILLAGVLLASYGVFQVQTETLKEVEQNQLDVKLLHAKVGFESESVVTRNLVSLLLEGDALVDFTRYIGRDIREYLVTQRLDYLINDVIEDKQSRIALTIFSSDGSVVYHYERSDNPFSSVPSYLPTFAASMFAKGEMESEKLMFLGDKNHAYLYGRTINATTFTTPIRGGLADSLAIVATVYTTKFDNELGRLEQEYGNMPLIVNRSQGLSVPDDVSWRSISLMKNYDLDMQLTDEYLSQTRNELINWMIVAATVLGGGMIILLLFLIKRFIIQPIETLDRQLNLVLEEQQANIQRPVGQDEVSSLGIKFYDLYDQLHANLRESRTLAVTDALTKLPNRTRFQEFAKRALVKAWNRNSHVSLIYIDLDNFKFVNDRLGHEAGDELLQEAASSFQHLLQSEHHRQKSALVSRLAGDEFAIVLAHDHLDDRLALAQDVVNLFEGGFKTKRYITPVSASIGIASYPNDGEDLRELIANADMAMYHAKRTGKNRFAAYSHTIAREARRVKLIEDALKFVNCDDEFSLVFMPFVDKDSNIRGLEVLLRWYSPELGQITPDEFVPIAEQTGTYTKIDDWVFRNAFSQLETLRGFLGQDIAIAINISAGELGQADFASKLVQLKQEYNVPDRSVELEITETFGYFAVEQVLTVLRELRNAGFGISIDDFGIGYTPLLQMIDYPVDKVKFDKQLVQRFTGEKNHPLLQPTVELCHLQSIQVTAEGVEDQTKFDQLREGGCDFFQGYAVAQPMTMNELRLWARRYAHNQEQR
ncbi:putative bifunctional diguanylate cyclase/phosphodiesterase [Marinomonas ostreistagni]|uniref:putative bifunctional diguanylate cyclase/phosphodiesterase n=1 Tax=Marinomonas ostreistagni TaxID=359209 RepID=UPI001950C02C|nr:EAL domain-containing protein [Marinomonas ostreistagni]MBM6550316.1 EAL domain-containing protein [Marinomonas ostreistagni]